MYSQLLQHLEFTLYLRGSVGIIAKPVNENLWMDECRHWSGSLTPCKSNIHEMGPSALPAPHLDMLAILLLCLIFTLLVE